MYSLEQIRAMSREAAKNAAQENLVPFVVERGDINSMPPFPFPFLGNHIPIGWHKVNEFFVDSSGFGADNEPALSVGQFLTKLKVGKGYAVTEAGQFQVYVGEYEEG